MAATLTPNAAFDNAKIFVRNMPLEDVRYRILDNANKMIWMAHPWRWTLGSVTNFNLADNTQDYTQAPPGDFLYTRYAYCTDGNTRPILVPVASLPTTEVIAAGTPSQIAFMGSNTWRLFPKPGAYGGTTWTVVQLYKKAAPLITVANAGTGGALVMDDEWFHVYEECVLYWAFKYAFDSREGQAQYDVSARKAVLGGQLAKAKYWIGQMAESEPLKLEEDLRPEREERKR